MDERDYTPVDRLLINFDQALRTLFGKPLGSGRPSPAAAMEEPELSPEQARLSAALMRVDHAGEVCAQALYQGQALSACAPEVRERMAHAAREENDHLDWCEQRIHEVGGRTSYLNPLWYGGAFALGTCAGFAGDQWSLGFVAETERQVVRHLEGHLTRLPPPDGKSRAVLEQMKEDELRHATVAAQAGGVPLPRPVKTLMALSSKLMTTAAFRL